jgi:hypothetical protein
MCLRNWKSTRLRAAGTVMGAHNQATKDHRFAHTVLQLTTGLVWMVNSINSRPDDGSAARDLMLTVLPVTNDYNDGNLLFPPPQNHDRNPDILYAPYGAVFFMRLKWPPLTEVPRLSWGHVMNDRSFKHFFGCTYFDLRAKYVRTGFMQRDQIPKAHVPTLKGKTTLHPNQDVDEALRAFHTLAIDVVPPQGIQDEEDMDIPPEELGQQQQDDMAIWTTKLWQQFLSDLLQKCGNSRGDSTIASHCRMTMAQRTSASMELYQQLNLALIFRRVQWRYADQKEWLHAFEIYWPKKNHVTGLSIQNLKTMQYYTTWKSQVAKLTMQEVEHIRNRLWVIFRSLKWIPNAKCDRVWDYKIDTKCQRFPTDIKQKAPQVIILLGSGKPNWEPQAFQGDDDASDEDGHHEQRDRERVHMQQMRKQWVGGIEPTNMDLYKDLREEEEEDEEI